MRGGSAHLLSQPHHDGSSLYVSTLAPQPGETVTVWLQVPVEASVADVHVRVVVDAEQVFLQATPDPSRSDDADTWWRAELDCQAMVTPYRWLLVGGDTGYAWLNGTGLHRRDVPDSSDFRIVAHHAPPPAWAADTVVYQIFPDRFAASSRSVVAGQDGSGRIPDWAVPARWDDPVVPRASGLVGKQLYGGDLDGIIEHLDHLERLGVDCIYLTPFFPARSNHRYDAATFERVDPVLGGDEALRRLTAAAHARGMRVLGDVTTNHTGSSHEWFLRAREDPRSVEHGFYYWTGPDTYVGWFGVPSLPKLNYDSAALKERIFQAEDGVVRRWLGPAGGLDGWRVDVANMTGRQGLSDHNHEVAALMRATVADADREALLVAEHCHDYTLDLPGDGWHGVMNYAGFTRPVWTWLADPRHPPNFIGAPVVVPTLDGTAMVETMRDFCSRVSWQAVTHSFNLVSSHDTSRLRSLVAHDPRLAEVAAGLLLTMPSIPMVTYGDEIGMEGENGEDGRRPMLWDESRWDTAMFETFRRLIALRREHVALRRGGLRWVVSEPDTVVYLRQCEDEAALVHVARAAHGPVTIDVRHLPGVDGGHTVYGAGARLDGNTFRFTADAPTVTVYVFEPARRRTPSAAPAAPRVDRSRR